jgi:hypothetical protein
MNGPARLAPQISVKLPATVEAAAQDLADIIGSGVLKIGHTNAKVDV